MKPSRFIPVMSSDYVPRQTLADRTADHLRERIRAGDWGDRLPGERRLSVLLGVSRPTVVAAVARLIGEGVLVSNGAKKVTGIAPAVAGNRMPKKSLKMTILLRWSLENISPATQRTVMQITSMLKSLGHDVGLVSVPAGADHRGTAYLPKLVKKHVSDAWLVVDGTKETLAWFVAGGYRVFAVAGSYMGQPVASGFSMDSRPLIRTIVRRLVTLGHERIVLICFATARGPGPTPLPTTFLEELTAAGIRPGAYNIPEWEETPQGLLRLLDSLFRLTPPTALICHNLGTTVGAHTFLAQRGLKSPRDVSLISLVGKDALAYWGALGVRVAHAEVNPAAYFNHLRKWTDNVVKGREDTREILGRGRLVEGDTIGPVSRSDE